MAERALATAFVNIVPGTKDFNTLLKSQLTGTMPGVGASAGGLFGNAFTRGLLAVGGVTAVVSGIKSQFEALSRIEVINTQTETVIKSMGNAAGISATQVEALAGALESKTATEAESIQQGANLLLTFGNIKNAAGAGNDVFNQSVALMTDLSRAMGTDASSSAIQLGKALNDPTKGVTALTRVGVSFTEQQKEQIKTLQESGDMMGAQKIILSELQNQFGGSGAAYAETFQGTIDRIGHAFGAFGETLAAEAMPALNEFADYIAATVVPNVQSFFADFEKGKTPLNDVINAIKGLFDTVRENWTLISTLTVAFAAGYAAIQAYNFAVNAGKVAMVAWNAIQTAGAVVMGVLRGQTVAATFAQLGLNTALLANPIGLVIAAVAALVAGLVYFFTQTKVGQETWKKFTGFLGTAFQSAGKAIGSVWDGILSAGKAVFNGLSSAVETWANVYVGAINLILEPLRFLLGIVKTLSGGTIDLRIPNVPPVKLPKLAKGGYVDQPTTAIIGEAGPEVVTPLKDFERMMGIGKASNGATLNYYAAPNESIDSEAALLQAVLRGRSLGAWSM